VSIVNYFYYCVTLTFKWVIVNKNSEQNILQRVADGDEQAFKVLFNLYWDRLYNYLLRITKSHELAEEIATDVFLKLWTGREILPGIQNMDSFLYKVAYNRTMDFFRLAARDFRLQELIAKQAEQVPPVSADYPMLDKEADQILKEVIQELTPQRRLIFTLSRIDGLTHEEIAQKLNLSRQTVKNTMSAAITSVRQTLKKKFPGSYSVMFILLDLYKE